MQTCKIGDCESPVRTAAYCVKHYLRVWRHGDPSTVKLVKITGTTQERFEKRIAKAKDGCWLWTGCLTRAGYGQLRVNGKVISTHRLAFELYRGEIPEGVEVCHKCDNPRCANPDHLFLGTHKENVIDMHAKGRWSNPNAPKGENNPQSKLTATKVKQMRKLRKNGFELKRLAEIFGVTSATVSKIVRMEAWRHV